MPATETTTADVPEIYRCFASAIGAAHWQGAVARQENAIRKNGFLRDYLRSEHAIAYQLDRLRNLVARLGKVLHASCNDQSIFPSLAFAAQVLEVLKSNRSRSKQAETFVKRVRTAFKSSENMHGLLLELQAATHFIRRGHRVGWHRTKNEGTFDLLIEDLGSNGLEVECKAISENKGRRIHRRDALEFLGELWKDLESVTQNLQSGLAVVLTIPNRLPKDAEQRASLARGVVAQIIVGRGATLNGGMTVGIEPFVLATVKAAESTEAFRAAIDAVTGTANREGIVCKTRAGGMLIFVVQSAVEDNVLAEVFCTFNDSAERQFTCNRGALFWVVLQGIDADQLLSLHNQDSISGGQPSALKLGVSNFLNRASQHIIGVVFCSKSSLLPVVDGSMESGGITNFFLNEESPRWHPSFRKPLTAEA